MVSSNPLQPCLATETTKVMPHVEDTTPSHIGVRHIHWRLSFKSFRGRYHLYYVKIDPSQGAKSAVLSLQSAYSSNTPSWWRFIYRVLLFHDIVVEDGTLAPVSIVVHCSKSPEKN
jgi:hypothetical protein